MRTKTALAVFLLTACAPFATLPAGAAVSAAPEQGRRNDFQWHGVIAAGSSVEIKGVNGAVSAEPAAGNEVEVVAVKTSRRDDPETVRIEAVEHGGGVTICAVYPSKDGDRPNQCAPGSEGRMNVQNNDVNVTFTVRVPQGVRFVGTTVNGNVDTGPLTGPVELRTVNGSVTFATSSYGEATTVNGSIKGSLGSADWADVLEFKTVNGSITLELPEHLSTDVRAESLNGDISTDFPITTTGRVSPRRLTGTIGAGGRSIEMTTVNGSVKLRRR
jgi:hypothetical protein